MSVTPLSTIALGLFGGAGVTLLWELILRPMRDRRNVAEVLSAEVSHNMQLLSAARAIANPSKVPPDFAPSTIVFDAIAEKIGELPPQSIAEVVFIYNYFRQLGEIPRTYVRYVDDLRSAPSESPHRAQMESEVRQCVAVFNSYVEKAIARVNIVQPLLLKSAFPWWSPRRYQRERPRVLSDDEMEARLRIGLAERAAVAQSVKRRSR